MRLFFETSGQAFVMLLMAYAGALLGVMMDVTAFVRRGRGGWLMALLDCLACFLTGMAVAGILIITRQEGLRLYGILGLLLGWLIYDLGLRVLFKAIAGWVCRWVKKSKPAFVSAGKSASEANTYENTKEDGGKSHEQS